MEKGKQLPKKLSGLNESDSKELIKSLIHDALMENDASNLTVKEKLQLLKQCKNLISTKQSFKVGDIVEWKPNLKNRAMPEYDDPMIILEILETPIFDTEDGPSSTYFNEPLDIVAGIIAEDEEFVTFYFDSRRFQKFKAK